jgi:hypothetical protein
MAAVTAWLCFDIYTFNDTQSFQEWMAAFFTKDVKAQDAGWRLFLVRQTPLTYT